MLDELSSESREKLKEQIRRVQEEARRLRAQARRLRHAQKAETKKRKRLVHQITQSSKEWGQDVLKRGGDLASSGSSLAGTQLRSGQQFMQEHGNNLVQDLGQRSGMAVKNLNDWRDDATRTLRKRSQTLTHDASEWGEETAHEMRKQGRNISRALSDWGDETLYKLQKQGQHLAKNLSERKEDTAHTLRKQGRSLARNITDTKNDAAHKLRKLSKQRISRDNHVWEKRRERRGKVWPIIGFISGVLLVGGVTFLLIRRLLTRSEEAERQQIELATPEALNGIVNRSSEEGRYTNQGGTAVATKPAKKRTGTAEDLGETKTRNKFVGVLSTRRYFPIEQRPDVDDVVFFLTEEDARAEGFTSAF